jgi:hypothetical protein
MPRECHEARQPLRRDSAADVKRRAHICLDPVETEATSPPERECKVGSKADLADPPRRTLETAGPLPKVSADA